jgi:hypothetical protein
VSPFERPFRHGVQVDAGGLPRPNPTIQSRQQHRRRYLLQQAGLELDSLPLGLQVLLTSTAKKRLTSAERQRLITALVARSVDVRGIGLALNLIGDKPMSGPELERLVVAAREQRERDLRPGLNFSVLEIKRAERGQQQPRFVLRLSLDGEPAEEVRVSFTAADLDSMLRFRVVCMRQANFAPVFKDHVDTQYYQRWIASLFDALRRDSDASTT